MGEVGVTQVELEGADSLALCPTEEMRCVCVCVNFSFLISMCCHLLVDWGKGGGGACAFQPQEGLTSHPPAHPPAHPCFIGRRRAAHEMQKVMDRVPQVEVSSFWRQINVDYAAVYANGACAATGFQDRFLRPFKIAPPHTHTLCTDL